MLESVSARLGHAPAVQTMLTHSAPPANPAINSRMLHAIGTHFETCSRHQGQRLKESKETDLQKAVQARTHGDLTCAEALHQHDLEDPGQLLHGSKGSWADLQTRDLEGQGLVASIWACQASMRFFLDSFATSPPHVLSFWKLRV